MNGTTALLYACDHLGSVRNVSDSIGNLLDSYRYDSFGTLLTKNTSALCDFRYANMYFHERSSLYLTTTRQYNPQTGAWLSRDPVESGGGLSYAYAANNPISNFDPFGLAPLTVYDFKGNYEKLGGFPGMGKYIWGYGISSASADYVLAKHGPDSAVNSNKPKGDAKWSPEAWGVNTSLISRVFLTGRSRREGNTTVWEARFPKDWYDNFCASCPDKKCLPIGKYYPQGAKDGIDVWGLRVIVNDNDVIINAYPIPIK